MRPTPSSLHTGRMHALALAACTVLAGGTAQAFEIDLGRPDLTLRWDNSLRLNYAQRVEQRDPKIGNSGRRHGPGLRDRPRPARPDAALGQQPAPELRAARGAARSEDRQFRIGR
ncbi:DUF1302 family protein [Aquabacterium sp.]|uniref:DUF1302 family protein n=1 Tax=Aquabacterium sp. TaxID=1872578 RepID=UPI00378317E7